MGGHAWAAGDDFSLADCAAIVRPFSPGQVRLAAYFERLLARPPVRRCIVDARLVFQYCPLRSDGP